jgi:hypothetical protein
MSSSESKTSSYESLEGTPENFKGGSEFENSDESENSDYVDQEGNAENFQAGSEFEDSEGDEDDEYVEEESFEIFKEVEEESTDGERSPAQIVRVAPKRAPVKVRITPKRVAPQRVAPQRVAPQRVAPKRVAPQRVAPQRVQTKVRITPKRVAPQRVQTKRVTPLQARKMAILEKRKARKVPVKNAGRSWENLITKDKYESSAFFETRKVITKLVATTELSEGFVEGGEAVIIARQITNKFWKGVTYDEMVEEDINTFVSKNEELAGFFGDSYTKSNDDDDAEEKDKTVIHIDFEGSRHFNVEVGEKLVQIFSVNDDGENETLISQTQYKKIHRNGSSESLLIELNDNSFFYVDETIRSFKISDKFLNFYLDENEAGSLDYIVGTKNIYLLDEFEFISVKEVEDRKKLGKEMLNDIVDLENPSIEYGDLKNIVLV